MSLPKKVYRDFFAVAQGRCEPKTEREGVYRFLVYRRYDEMLSGAFGRFKAGIKKTEWEALVRGFVARGARKRLIWKMPNEFCRWVLKKRANQKRRPWARDLLWFEWQQMRLMMRQPTKHNRRFDLLKPVALAKTAKVRKLKYPVHTQAFRHKKACGVVVFLNPETLITEFLEITPFMADFLKQLKKPALLDNALKTTCKKYRLDPREVAPVMAEAYRIFWQKGIFV